MATIKPVTVPSKRLATSISASDTTFKLNNILGWDGANLSSASFGTKLYCVFRDSAGTVMELMEIDPTTIISASSAITILQRGLNFNGDYTTPVTANKLSWVKGDTIVELGTHIPQLLAHYVDVIADQTIAGVKTFSAVPVTTGGNPISANDLARKAYVDGLVLGTLTTLDVVVPGTADTTVAAGQVLYLKTSNGRWALASAASATTSENVLLGIAQGAGTSGTTISGGVLLQGADANQSGLVTGNLMYLSDTPGAIATSAGTKHVVVGVAKDATNLYFDPRFDQELTQDQIDALAGTSGTALSASNKLVDNADTTGTGSVVRLSKISAIKFGGDGSDGALTISSGTTTIDLASAAVVVKNYTSISITGTGKLAFSNPGTNGTLIILKSQGNVTLTSSQAPMIDASGMGGAGGASVTSTSNNNVNIPGNNGNDGIGAIIGGGAGTAGGASTTVGVGGTYAITKTISKFLMKYAGAYCGGGGGSGSALWVTAQTSGVSGAGGNGGGGLIIECAGALNFTTASGISVAGANGGSGVSNGSGTNGGGGGGGAGGLFLCLYNTLTAASGTVTVTGGTGGNCGGNTGGDSSNGGGGGGSVTTAGSSGTSSGTNNAKTGGDGAAGLSIIAANTDYV